MRIRGKLQFRRTWREAGRITSSISDTRITSPSLGFCSCTSLGKTCVNMASRWNFSCIHAFSSYSLEPGSDVLDTGGGASVRT